MSDRALLLHALLRPRFRVLTEAAVTIGLDTLQCEWRPRDFAVRH
jgi:hypothetical protein